MHPHLQSIAIVAYVCAMGLALTHLVQRQPLVHRLAALSTLIGWVAHTLALIVLAIEVGRPPLGTLANAVSVVVWVVVLLEMLVERQSGVTVLGAFVMPVVVMLSLKASVARPASSSARSGRARRGAASSRSTRSRSSRSWPGSSTPARSPAAPRAVGTGAAPRISRSLALLRSSSRSARGCSCPDGTAPDGALRCRAEPQERAGRAARAVGGRRGQGPRDPARPRGWRRAARGRDAVDVQSRRGLRRRRGAGRGARRRVPPSVPAARRGRVSRRGRPL